MDPVAGAFFPFFGERLGWHILFVAPSNIVPASRVRGSDSNLRTFALVNNNEPRCSRCDRLPSEMAYFHRALQPYSALDDPFVCENVLCHLD